MKYFEIADKTKINWVETDIFAGLSYLDDIIEPETGPQVHAYTSIHT